MPMDLSENILESFSRPTSITRKFSFFEKFKILLFERVFEIFVESLEALLL